MRLTRALTTGGAVVLGCLLLAPAAFAADGESTPLNLPSQTKVNANLGEVNLDGVTHGRLEAGQTGLRSEWKLRF